MDGTPGVRGFDGDRGEAGFPGEKGVAGIGFNITYVNSEHTRQN